MKWTQALDSRSADDHWIRKHYQAEMLKEYKTGCETVKMTIQNALSPKPAKTTTHFTGRTRSDSFCQPRLVYVGKPCPGHDPRVIVPSREFPTGLVDPNHIRYLALSYCWGSMEEGQRPLVSTVETLDDRQEAIPWATIPKAFQDLIFLARTLGIYYVWIDSLCIIQGEGGDWDQESSKMWSVYSNAFLTVIAAAGSSSHVGFLNRPLSRCCRVMLPKPSAQYSLRYRPGTKWWGTDRMAEITGKAWISRGWTYQEERLARRVLMFGENKFFFDCRMAERAEDTAAWSPRPEWSEIIYTQNLDDGSGLTPGTKGKSVGDKKRRLFNDWQWFMHAVFSQSTELPPRQAASILWRS